MRTKYPLFISAIQHRATHNHSGLYHCVQPVSLHVDLSVFEGWFMEEIRLLGTDNL